MARPFSRTDWEIRTQEDLLAWRVLDSQVPLGLSI
jgi:hypothetical protein